MNSLRRLPASLLQNRRIPAAVPVLALATLLTLINPFGYRGGGSDDFHYLEAARCAVEMHAPCLPVTHWGARYPLILALSAAIAMFGETRLALILPSLLYGFAAIILLVRIVERQFGRLEALIAGFTMVTTPIVGLQLIALNVDIVELCFALASIFAMQKAVPSTDRRWAAISGVLLGLAVMSRTTALTFIPMAAIVFIFMRTPARRLAKPFAIGLAATFLVDAAVYAVWAHDPLYGWHLALSHAQLPSTEIATPLAAGESPLFNLHLITGWKRTMGISVHWTVDALLNLIADPSIGLTFVLMAVLLILYRRNMNVVTSILLTCAIVHFSMLVFGLAIDPKPRMFLPEVAVAAAIIGQLGAHAWRAGGSTPFTACLMFFGLITACSNYDAYHLAPIEVAAPAWTNETPGRISAGETGRRLFTLQPSIRNLPQTGSSIDRLIDAGIGDCPHPEGWHLIRKRLFRPEDPAWIANLRTRHILFGQVEPTALCLFAKQVHDQDSDRQITAPLR